MAKGFDPAELMNQARRMKDQIQRVQQKLKERIVEGDAGGGVVKVYVNCRRELMGVKIAPEAVDATDLSMLEDLVMIAVNNGLKRALEVEEEELNKVSGGAGLGGLL